MAEIIETNPRRPRWAVPTLRGNKLYHVFFFYASENSIDVKKIIENLEKRGIVCGFHERDFEPGSRVLANVDDALEYTENVVFILSEHFRKSEFCMKYEIDQAVLKSVSNRIEIIPVKIEPCTVPPAIRHLTYIDAENDDIDSIHSRIYDAIFKKDLRREREKGSNGMVYRVGYKKSNHRCFARYHLEIDEETRAYLRQLDYKIPGEVLDKVVRIVNCSLSVKYKHVFDWFKTIMFLVFVMVMLVFIAISMLIITLTSSKTAVENENAPVYVISFGSTALVLLFTVCACVDWCDRCSCCGGSRKARAESLRHVNRVLWDRINCRTYNTINVMFFVQEVALHVLHVNITPCKEYFMRHVRPQDLFGTGDAAEEELEQYTERTFNIGLRYFGRELLIPRYSHQQRHYMANIALCACQILQERNLFNVKK